MKLTTRNASMCYFSNYSTQYGKCKAMCRRKLVPSGGVTKVKDCFKNCDILIELHISSATVLYHIKDYKYV